MNVQSLTTAAIVLLAVTPQQRPLQLPASIEGIVVKAGTNEPIQEATVELTGIAPRTVQGSATNSPGTIFVSVQETGSDGRVLSFTATTGRDGRFTIRNVPPTSGYQLIAIRQPDYLPAQYGQRVPALPGRPIALADGQQLNDIRIEMTPAASVSGLVVDSNGQPVPNFNLELRRPWYLEGWRLIADWQQTIPRVRGVGRTNSAGSARTNGRGEFRFEGLAPAHYYVRSTVHDDQATLLHVHAGANIQDVRVLARYLVPRHVRGVIVRSGAGDAAASANLVVTRSGAIPLYQNAVNAAASRAGAFDVTISEPGEYFLIATERSRQGLSYGRQAIRVGDLDVDSVRVEIAPTFEIAGTVVTDNASAPVSVSLYPLTAGTPSVAPVSVTTSRGSFTLHDVTPGDFRVEVDPILRVPPSTLVPANLQNAYVKSIRIGGTDVLNGGLHLKSSVNAALEIVISTHGGALTGRVLDQSGKPAINAKVVIVPDDAHRQRGDLYRNVSADDSGSYQLQGLPPGDYKLFAWERVEDGAWQDPEFLKLYEDRGTNVRIREDARQTADATLILAWN